MPPRGLPTCHFCRFHGLGIVRTKNHKCPHKGCLCSICWFRRGSQHVYNIHKDMRAQGNRPINMVSIQNLVNELRKLPSVNVQQPVTCLDYMAQGLEENPENYIRSVRGEIGHQYIQQAPNGEIRAPNKKNNRGNTRSGRYGPIRRDATSRVPQVQMSNDIQNTEYPNTPEVDLEFRPPNDNPIVNSNSEATTASRPIDINVIPKPQKIIRRGKK